MTATPMKASFDLKSVTAYRLRNTDIEDSYSKLHSTGECTLAGRPKKNMQPEVQFRRH